jgi:YVTN family beta-propeller protein
MASLPSRRSVRDTVHLGLLHEHGRLRGKSRFGIVVATGALALLLSSTAFVALVQPETGAAHWSNYGSDLRLPPTIVPPAHPTVDSSLADRKNFGHVPTPEASVRSISTHSNGPAVIGTLVLFNNSLQPGNFNAANGQFPQAGAFDSENGEVFVSVYGSNIVDVINEVTNSVVRSIWVGSSPLGVAYDPQKGEIFVANYGSNSVSVINDTTNSVVATIATGSYSYPFCVSYDSSKSEVFVGDAGIGDSGNVTVISDVTNTVVATIPVGVGPGALAYDSGRGEVFVANYNTNDVSVINDTSDLVTATVPVGLEPTAVAYDPVQGEVFVANFEPSSDNLSVINDSTDTTVASVPVGVSPVAALYDDRKGEVFVSNSYSDNVTVVNTTTDTVVANVATGGYPEVVAYDGDRGEVFVANSVDNVSVIDDADNRVTTTIAVGSFPDAEVYDSGRGEVYVADLDSPFVYVIDDATNRVVTRITVGNQPEGLAYDSKRGEVFVANDLSNDVSVINDSTNRVITNVTVGVSPGGIAYDSGKGEVFVSSFLQNNLSVINDSTDKVVASVAVGADPYGVSYDPDRGEVFVANFASDNVSVINDTANQVVANVGVGIGPAATLYDSARGEVFVANVQSANVSVINDSTNSVTANIPVGDNPADLAYDAGSGKVFVANGDSNNVSVIADSTDVVAASVAVGRSPEAIVYDSHERYVYVADYLDGTISIISPVTYTVTFNETGLPAGVGWYLNVTDQGGLLTTEPDLAFGLPNGTYNYSITTSDKQFQPFPTGGEFTVAGSNLSVSAVFTLVNFSVTFIEAGLPLGTNWSVRLNGTPGVSELVNITFTEPNGTYSYTARTSDSAYAPASYAGSVVVEGAPADVDVAFISTESTISFTESGLPAGTNWTVSIGGEQLETSASHILFGELNGTYVYTVGVVTGYAASPPSGSVDVTGTSVAVPISFVAIQPTTYTVTFQETGLPTDTNWSVTLASRTIFSSNSTISFQQPNGSFVYEVGQVAGYTFRTPDPSVFISGTPVEVTVPFTPISTPHASSPTDSYEILALAVAVVVVAFAVILILWRRKVPPGSESKPPHAQGNGPGPPS